MQKTSSYTTLLLSLSAAFEYYDFIIYGLMATYLGPLFFPNDSEMVSHLQAFAVFALGYLVRPLGGIILGMLGDLTSRKTIFFWSNLTLALATLGISLLPSYANIGITATILIILFRILQSFSFAAEMPGAMSLIKDTSKTPEKSFSFVISGASIGAILASLILYLLENNFSKQEILDFAWRIPFAFGSILCAISFIMRRKLINSVQLKPQDKRDWLTSLFTEYKKAIACILIISVSAYLILMNLFFPSFLPKFYGFTSKEVYLSITISLIWSSLYALIFGHLTAKISKISLLQSVIVASIFLSILIHYLLLKGNLIFALCLYQSIITSLMVITFPLMAETFTSSTRFTIMAICYNITFAIISFIPIGVMNMATTMNGPIIMWIIFILLCVFTLGNMSAIYRKE